MHLTVCNIPRKRHADTSSNFNCLISYQLLSLKPIPSVLQIQYMQTNLEEVKNRYSLQLGQLQATITALEMELQELKVSIEKQQSEYKLLLDIKMRLEMEIAEYRRLLDGEQTIQIQEKK